MDRDETIAAKGGAGTSGGSRLLLGLIATAAAISAAIYLWWQWHSTATAPEAVAVPPVASAPPTPITQPQEEVPPVQHPLDTAQAAEPLPELEDSDSTIARAITALVGDKQFGALFISEHIVRHIVATVDNLPREEVPVKMWPVRPVGSWLDTAGTGEDFAIGPKNAARYAAYVKLVKELDVQKLATSYRQLYSLFQQAYRDLGYPKGNFNDRLIVAIDDLLATPEPKESLRLVQEKVRYQFADPALERRSAGQKILLRIGVDNARVVKAKLRDFRQYVAKR